MEHGRLELKIEIALSARSHGAFAASERALADDLGEAGAGGGFGQGFVLGAKAAAIYRRTRVHSRAMSRRQQSRCHHPRARMIQYSATAVVSLQGSGYWIPRFSGG